MPAESSLVGEPLALDLVNTRTATADLLATPDDLRAWLARQSDRLRDPDGAEAATLGAADLATVRDVREQTATALAHLRRGEAPPATAIGHLNDAQRAAPAIHELTLDGATVSAVPTRTGTSGARLVAWLAEAAAELLSGGDVARIRECAADDCVMLFVAANPRRRWCTANVCGNRARVARHYRRHKTGRAG